MLQCKCMPPFTVYKSLHLYDVWTRERLAGATYGCTDLGWMIDSVFQKWLQYFTKYVETLKKKQYYSSMMDMPVI